MVSFGEFNQLFSDLYQLYPIFSEYRREGTISQFNILLVVVGFKLRASHLLSRHTVTWAMPPALFVLLILETGSHFLSRLALTLIFLLYSSYCTLDDRYTIISAVS
jgi:hypothetical protein